MLQSVCIHRLIDGINRSINGMTYGRMVGDRSGCLAFVSGGDGPSTLPPPPPMQERISEPTPPGHPYHTLFDNVKHQRITVKHVDGEIRQHLLLCSCVIAMTTTILIHFVHDPGSHTSAPPYSSIDQAAVKRLNILGNTTVKHIRSAPMLHNEFIKCM